MSGRFPAGQKSFTRVRAPLANAGTAANPDLGLSAATASAAGSMAAADKALLDTATSAATANSLAGRDGNGIALFNHEAPTAVTYANGFADSGTYGPVKFWKDNQGLVHFEGSATRAAGAPAGGTVICTLPAGYRPLALTNAYVETDTTRCQLNILTNGDVQWFSGGTAFINLADITPYRTS